MLSVEHDAIDIHAHSFLASAYTHPADVLADPSLTSIEKRCILAAWASDAFAVEDMPWLRQTARHKPPVPLSDILSALRRLDDDDDDPPRGGASSKVPHTGDDELYLTAAIARGHPCLSRSSSDPP